MNEGTPILDLDRLSELREMLEEGLDELLDAYLVDTDSQLAQLRMAVDSGSAGDIAAVAHALKGSSGNLGITRVYLLSQVLELEAKGGAVADGEASLSAIESAFEQARQELAAFKG